MTESIYLLLPDEAGAQTLSRGLYRLSRPLELSEAEGDGTLYALGWLVHSDGRAALEAADADGRAEASAELPDNLTPYPRHPEVAAQLNDPESESSTLFAQLMGGLVASPEDGAAMQAYVIANDQIDLFGLLAHLDPALVKTRADLSADGWHS